MGQVVGTMGGHMTALSPWSKVLPWTAARQDKTGQVTAINWLLMNKTLNNDENRKKNLSKKSFSCLLGFRT